MKCTILVKFPNLSGQNGLPLAGISGTATGRVMLRRVCCFRVRRAFCCFCSDSAIFISLLPWLSFLSPLYPSLVEYDILQGVQYKLSLLWIKQAVSFHGPYNWQLCCFLYSPVSWKSLHHPQIQKLKASQIVLRFFHLGNMPELDLFLFMLTWVYVLYIKIPFIL